MRSISPVFGGAASRFGASQQGSIIGLFAFLMIPLICAVGLAVDGARGYMVKQKLSHAVDAAGLAAARTVGTDDFEGDLQKYFDANFPPGYMGATVTGPDFAVSDDDDVITLSAQATVTTTFMGVFGFGEYPVSAQAEVTRDAGRVELVMAIDMSGSMSSSAGSGKSRIQAARDAAVQLVNILYGDEETKDSLKIGLVPWNAKVNVTENGSTYDSTNVTVTAVPNFINPITGEPQSEVYYANNSPVPLLFQPLDGWLGCVYARYTDDGDSSNDADTSYGIGTYGVARWEGWEPGFWGGGIAGGDDAGDDDDDDDDDDSSSSSGPGSDDNTCLDTGITALRSSKSQILSAIAELTDPRDVTNIAQGLAWAWRVLMPEEPFTEGEADSTNPPYRAIVLLTDGEHWGGDNDAYKGAFGTGSGAQVGLDPRLQDLADTIKGEGVVIYTIQFANADTDLETLMKGVATSSALPHYQYAPDSATLEQVFTDIGNDIVGVRLSK